jgi:hypothetical protein
MSKLYYGPALDIVGHQPACIGFSPAECSPAARLTMFHPAILLYIDVV